MASRVFSKTKHTYSMPLSHELEAPPLASHSHLHTPKIPPPRSALILCAVPEISAAFLSVLENFSPEASCCRGERDVTKGVEEGEERGLGGVWGGFLVCEGD